MAAAKLSNTGPTLRRMVFGQPPRQDQWESKSSSSRRSPAQAPAGAAPEPGSRPVRGWRDHGSDARSLHAAQLVLELPDLVPDPGGDLELQLRGRGVHLLGELGDEGDQVAAGFPAARCRA